MHFFRGPLSRSHSPQSTFLEDSRGLNEFETRARPRSLPERLDFSSLPEELLNLSDGEAPIKVSLSESPRWGWPIENKQKFEEQSTLGISAFEPDESIANLAEVLPRGLEAEGLKDTSRLRKSKISKLNRSSTASVTQATVSQLVSDRKKVYGSEKKTKLEVKVVRTRQYWNTSSNFAPNVFRMMMVIDDPELVLEFQDFSRKEVLAEGVVELD